MRHKTGCGITSVGSWRREAERFRRREAGAGGSSGATEPRPNGSATRLRYLKAGTSTRGVERAAGASGCGRGTKRVLVQADSRWLSIACASPWVVDADFSVLTVALRDGEVELV